MFVTFSVISYFAFMARVDATSNQNFTGNIFCYYLSNNAYSAVTPEELDPYLCTHIAYAFVSLNKNGSLFSPNPKLDIDRGVYKRVTSLKKINPNLKVMLSVGGVSETVFSKVAANNESRISFAESSSFFLETYNFDGIDIDWERPLDKDKDNFVLLLRDLNEQFKNKNWTVSVALYPYPYTGYDVLGISRYVDMLNVMTYNFYGPWSSYTGQNSPLYASSIESPYEKSHLNLNVSIHYWINAGAPPGKINAGMAFYGRSFTLLNESIHGLHAPFNKSECGTYTFKQICSKLSNWTTVWEDDQKNPYKYEGNQWLSYDDERSIRDKAKYVKANSLGGAMIWQIAQDDVSGVCGTKQVLLKVINEVMKQSVT